MGNAQTKSSNYPQENNLLASLAIPLLSVFTIYLAVYYFLIRDPNNSIVNPYLVITALILCLVALGISLSKYLQYRAEQNYYLQYQSQNYQLGMTPSQAYYASREQHLKNVQQKDLESKLDPNISTTRIGTYMPTHTVTSMYNPTEYGLETRQRNPYERRENLNTLGPSPMNYQSYSPNIQYENYNKITPTPSLERKWLPECSKNPNISSYYGETKNDMLDYDQTQINQKAKELFEILKISRKIPVWVENIRCWIANNFIPMILKCHFENLEQLNKILSQYNRRVVFSRTEDYSLADTIKPILWDELYDFIINQTPGFGILPSYTPTSFSMPGQMQISAAEIQTREFLKHLVEERADIEKYFRLQSSSLKNREYVIERLKVLQSNFTFEYKNNSGMSWQGEPWTPSLPRDSDVFYQFFYFLDNFMDFLQNVNTPFFQPYSCPCRII